jgi:hypothetical protein
LHQPSPTCHRSGGAVIDDGNHLDRVFDVNPGNVAAKVMAMKRFPPLLTLRPRDSDRILFLSSDDTHASPRR